MDNSNGAPAGGQLPPQGEGESQDNGRFFYSGGLKVSDAGLRAIGGIIVLPVFTYCWFSKTPPAQVSPKGYVLCGVVVLVTTFYLYPAFLPLVALSAAAGALFFLRSDDSDTRSAGGMAMLLLVLLGAFMSRNLSDYQGDLGDMNTTVEIIRKIDSDDVEIDDLPPHIQDQLRAYKQQGEMGDPMYDPENGQFIPGGQGLQPERPRQMGKDPFAGYDFSKE